MNSLSIYHKFGNFCNILRLFVFRRLLLDCHKSAEFERLGLLVGTHNNWTFENISIRR